MEHKICRKNLSAYLDNELPAGEKLAVEGHLASCADFFKLRTGGVLLWRDPR